MSISRMFSAVIPSRSLLRRSYRPLRPLAFSAPPFCPDPSASQKNIVPLCTPLSIVSLAKAVSLSKN